MTFWIMTVMNKLCEHPEKTHSRCHAISVVLGRVAFVLGLGLVLLSLARCSSAPPAPPAHANSRQVTTTRSYEVTHTDSEWRRILTAEQYQVLRQKGTERAFTGQLNTHREEGSYLCAGCGQDLFHSSDKYDSGSGWPSFTRPMPSAIQEHRDHSRGMDRTEVVCARCGGHLGHVFPDGPAPTGLRYCVNSVSLKFQPGETR